MPSSALIAADEVAARVIGERPEHAVQVYAGGRRNDWHSYNLVVVSTRCQARGALLQRKAPVGLFSEKLPFVREVCV
jgi:hypothetical protein